MSAEVASGILHLRRAFMPSTASSVIGTASSRTLSTFLLSERSWIGVHVWGMTTRNIPSTWTPFLERIFSAIPPAFPGERPHVTATNTYVPGPTRMSAFSRKSATIVGRPEKYTGNTNPRGSPAGASNLVSPSLRHPSILRTWPPPASDIFWARKRELPVAEKQNSMDYEKGPAGAGSGFRSR